MLMSKRILAIGLGLAGGLWSGVPNAAAQARTPVQVELVGSVEAGRVKAGDLILAKTAVKWQSPECTLRQGAILDGRIVEQRPRSKTDKTSEIALLFDSAQCDGRDMKPLPLTVASVLAADPARDNGNYENQPLSAAVGLGLGSGPGPNGSGPNGGGGSSGRTRSVMQAAATV
jgi:hypothetical protein